MLCTFPLKTRLGKASAETNIILREDQNALLVPTAAVSGDRVWRVSDGKAVPQSVETGAKTPEAIEIRGGISPDSLIVKDASLPPDPGRPVKIQIEDWQAP